MKKLLLVLMGSLMLAACGGDDTLSGTASSSSSSATSSSSSSATTTVASVELLASSPQLPSNDSTPITITALVLNAANQTMANQPVVITTNSGYLDSVQTVTGTNGTATAVLHTSDKTNRNITVSAVAGGITDTVAVSVTGTRLTVSGSSAMVLGDSADFTFTLVDSGGTGIAGQAVVVTSAAANTLSSSNLTTDNTGKVTVRLTATHGGADTLTATALGLSATQALTVSSDSFAFTTPAANTEIPLNQVTTLTALWKLNNSPQVGQTVTFASTRGTLSGSTATTNSSGQASVTISSTNAGPATLTATTSSGSVTQVKVEFVATTAAAINVQASPATVATGAQSTISAVVRDAANNLVKGKIVTFSLVDSSGGSLSIASAATDSEGKAQTVYTASSSPSATNGVSVTATVSDTPSVHGTATLTVAQKALFISLGTGNSISEPNAAQYSILYAIQVTDANGNGVANVALTVRISSLWYGTGGRCFNGSTWVVGAPFGGTCTSRDYVDACTDEDSLLGSSSSYFRNGNLDAGEDFNGNGKLEAGNIATVTPTSVVTDSSGFALVNVFYPQEYTDWLKVELSASTSVSGTESSRVVSFTLPGLGSDFNSASLAPPGLISPFGTTDYGCTTPANFP
ncbi:MAG: Ig-like domain-containing protein [Steroidobacteraceae bacterium]